MNTEPIPYEVIEKICALLGVDPDAVEAIKITPERVIIVALSFAGEGTPIERRIVR